MDKFDHGSIYPAVIARLETGGVVNGWELTLDGHSKTFPTYDDAHMTARNLLAYPVSRKQWARI